MKVNVGGDRLGSGAKMNVELHNYYRSTHNLNKKFQSSLAPGVLYPAYVNIGLNGDKFDIDIKEITRTLPTKGPLFGRFKMQIDCFVAPIRLYHGILHNNPINIGLKMNEVILPKTKLVTTIKESAHKPENSYQIAPSNLWAYLGVRGLGKVNYEKPATSQVIAERKFNAIPMLAYYDIFKNYYANKQEDNAYVILKDYTTAGIAKMYQQIPPGSYALLQPETDGSYKVEKALQMMVKQNYMIYGPNLTAKDIAVQLRDNEHSAMPMCTLEELFNGKYNDVAQFKLVREKPGDIQFTFENISLDRVIFSVIQNETKIKLQPFALENIDKMREKLLGIKLGEEFSPESTGLLPYTLNTSESEYYKDTQSNMTGLVVKTYQSDLFNNWIKTETITGQNGIAEITRVDTSNGLDLDALNLAQKVYNMLNRIAVSGGTYEDWQESVYTESAIRKAETPMYMGGYSSEIMFEEVIATTEQGTDQKLGSIGGRGKQLMEKGGHIKFTVEEPSIIMCMVSFTPRISYSQGNKWFMTDLDSIDDLHKPALDGIGYQDLLVEQMVFTGTEIDTSGNIINRLSAGKVPAWINYMTDIDECYADFALNEGYSFMALNRNYETKTNGEFVTPKDITTYIDPAKYNYAFAVTSIDAQNFWTEIQFDVTARRLMSAKQIPNL